MQGAGLIPTSSNEPCWYIVTLLTTRHSYHRPNVSSVAQSRTWSPSCLAGTNHMARGATPLMHVKPHFATDTWDRQRKCVSTHVACPRWQWVTQCTYRTRPGIIYPLKWDKTGRVVEVRQFDQYLVRVDGSGLTKLPNRKFLRKYSAVYDATPPTQLPVRRPIPTIIEQGAVTPGTYLAARPTTQAPSSDRQNDDNTPVLSPLPQAQHTEPTPSVPPQPRPVHVATPTTPLPPGSPETPASHVYPVEIPSTSWWNYS